jgi:pimeloyl-ACP methyl ester carboxylesterase
MSISSAIRGTPSFHCFSLGAVFASVALAALLAAPPASAHAKGDDLDDAFADRALSARDVFLDDVELRPGVTADIHLRVLSAPRPGCRRKAIVAVHGAVATASTLVGLGQAILTSSDDDEGGERACRFISVDLPGHDESPPPVGTLFGDLSVEDYAAAVLGVLDRLQERGIHTTTLMGHSMGGLVVHLAQQRLIDSGSSLREAYDVKHVVLFAAAAWPDDVSCAVCQNPALAATLGMYMGFDPVLGLRVQLPPAVFIALAFSRPDGTIATNAPTPAEVGALGYDSPESATALAGVLGAPTTPRADFDPGIFCRHFGTKLDLVSFQNDVIVRPAENEALFHYDTGERPELGFTTVGGPNAVHGLPVSDPAGMLAALKGRVKFR